MDTSRPLGNLQVSRELLYRSLFEHALVEVHIWQVVRDAQGAVATWRLVDANTRALKSWGRNLADIVGKTTDEIFPGVGAVQTFLPVVEEILRTGRPKEWEVGFAGTGQVLHMISIPVGESFVSTGFDVTIERSRQLELQDALRSLTQATRAGGVGLWDWNLETNTVRFSEEYKRQLGYEPHEFSDSFEEWRVRVHPDDLEPTLASVRAKIEHPEIAYAPVFRMRHKDGSYRWILAQASIVPREDGTPQRMLGSHVDITERRRLEEKLTQAQKLESLGTLAAGIAHDFNNLLGAIKGNLSLLRETPAADAQVPVLLRELDDAAVRATALTRQLLAFAKGGSPVRDTASVRALVEDSATFVTRGSNVRCQFHFADDLAAVEADVGQLSQVIDNLVINAMQAMPQGGTVRIDARNTSLADGNDLGLLAGHYVRISVADEGPGVPPELLPRIFDPFFTTKQNGSGLGLSSSYAIVHRHGGRLAVRTAVGRGAIFDVFLPSSVATPRPIPTPKIVRGEGRILVMDDDSAIRSVTRSMIVRLGYTCDTAKDGEEAVQRFGGALREGRPYRAVVLDLTIPGNRGGEAVLELLRALDPQVVAIVASGYSNVDVVARYEAHGFRGRLQKPFDLQSLGAELARVLA